ncbi:MAG: glycine betaine ABC transporter substrate-binding protein [Pseudomonadota bacterium]
MLTSLASLTLSDCISLMAKRLTIALALAMLPLTVAMAETVGVGSKNFPESYLLAEIAAQWLEADGHRVERRFGFGGTQLVYGALTGGDVDIYPEYSGTITRTILNDPSIDGNESKLTSELDKRRLAFIGRLGFNNTYAVAVRRQQAAERGWRDISDLDGAGGIELAFSHEFMQRDDGWPGLAARYGLTQIARGIEHGLAYRALANGDIDGTDAYSTDGDIERFDLLLLGDSANYFPRYDAGWLIRDDLPEAIRQRLGELAGTLSDDTMRALNARVVVDGLSFPAAASEFLASRGVSNTNTAGDSTAIVLGPLIVRHIQLTLVAIVAATIAGFALALAVHRSARWSGIALYIAGLIQTVPSIALLALMIPLLGIGFIPALTALFLYALLPVLRATLTALGAIAPVYRRVAAAMGMSARQEFVHVLLPLALPHALAGIRTASIICIGTATLAAFIGAGGLGEPIVTGLALSDTRMILSGAIPAAILAMGTDLGFDLLERRIIAPHMRVGR